MPNKPRRASEWRFLITLPLNHAEDVKLLARLYGTSTNALIGRAIESLLQQCRDQIIKAREKSA